MTTPAPPYYAVIFSSQQSAHADGFALMADRMEALAKTMPGYLGMDAARGPNGFGVTVSYWESEAAIASWKANAEHREAQRNGHDHWYTNFYIRVAKVERTYSNTQTEKQRGRVK